MKIMISVISALMITVSSALLVSADSVKVVTNRICISDILSGKLCGTDINRIVNSIGDLNSCKNENEICKKIENCIPQNCSSGEIKDIVNGLIQKCGLTGTYDIDKIIEKVNNDCIGGNCKEEKQGTPAEQQNNGENEKAPDAKEEVNAPENNNGQQTDDNYNYAYANEVVRLVNIERAKYGLPALTVNTNATNAAKIRAEEITHSFSHTRPNGSSCFTVAKELGFTYRSAGENIAYGQRTPAEVVNAWMNSEGHRANILNSSFTGIGVSCYVRNGVCYWAQFFVG